MKINVLFKLPLLGKFLTVYFVVIGIVAGGLVFCVQGLDRVMQGDFGSGFSAFSSLFPEFARIAIISGLVLFLVVALFYFYVRLFLEQINAVLRMALTERKLNKNFEELSSGKRFSSVLENATSIFVLFRSFDNMKASQVALEANSINTIMDNVEDGVLMVSNDRVVTHINHKAEMMLRLIPGEILGQSVSRKLSNPELLDNLDKALDTNHRVTDVIIKIKDNEVLELNIFPVKNKFGEIVRAIIVLKHHMIEAQEEG